MYISAASKGDPRGIYEEKREVYNLWKDFIEEYKKEAPESMRNVQFHGGFEMAFGATEIEFFRGATSGIFIAILFSFLILLIATRNII